MKQLFTFALLGLFVTDAFADDWRMRKFDANSDGSVVVSELKAKGCTVKKGLFNYADKNDDGKLSPKELRKATNYMVRSKCPRD